NGTVTGRIVTTQTWDDDSLILARTDDNKNATRYGYDNLRRLTRISYADTTTRTTTYNTDNQLIGWTDQNGTIATMRNVDYDGLSRLRLRKITPSTAFPVKGCTEERFFYDGASRATLIQNNDIFSRTAFMSCVFGYDSLDNRTLDQQATWRVDSVFDGVSNRVRCTYPGDFGGPGRRQLSGVFDRLNRLRSVSDSAGVIATMHYKGPTRLERRTYGVDATPISKLDCGYDKLPRLIDMVHQTGASQLIAGFQYGHDRMHHRLFEKRVHQGNSGDVYAYDSIYRVAANKQKVNLSAVSAGQEILPENFSSRDSLAYSYDGAGNRDKVVKTVNNVPTTTVYTHNNMNKYASVKEGSKAAQLFKCDNNGNPISDGTRTYAYDFKNRLVEVSQGTKILVQYSYDAIDRRPKKVLDPKGTTPTTVIYLYDGQQVVEERDGKGNLLRQFVWGAGVDQLCQYKTGKLAAQTFYAHENAIGSIAALVDGAGKTVERYDYDPFGNTTVTLNGSTGNEYRFHAARFDPETGLYHMRARHYSPSLGRFFQRDPIGIWTDDINLGNGYTFGGNDCINHRDPLGLHFLVHPATGAPLPHRDTEGGGAVVDHSCDAWGNCPPDDSQTRGTIICFLICAPPYCGG
ncbi:MAG: RHS repeat domain-containing protein, partial [Planctomycetota bacterium]